MALLGADCRRDFEIHRYPLLVYALVPLASLVLQAWLPRVVGRYDWFDLPLVITVYFALGRRNPIQGTMMGAGMGLFEDALSHHAIGVNGIAKTVVGFSGGFCRHSHRSREPDRSPAAQFRAFTAFERDLLFHLPFYAGPGARVELADGTVARGGEFGDCAGAVSVAGSSADQGMRQGTREREKYEPWFRKWFGQLKQPSGTKAPRLYWPFAARLSRALSRTPFMRPVPGD